MGLIISKFRKEKTTEVILEGLKLQIQELENYSINTQEQKKRFVATFLGVSIGIYVILFVLMYFFYLPSTWSDRIVYLVPLMLVPAFIIMLRKLFTWYFQRKLNKNSNKLKALREKKAQILEQVMDKETYKVALNLLERFGDKKPSRISIGTTTTRTQNLNTTLSANTSLNPSQQTPRISVLPATPQQQQRKVVPVASYTGVYRSLSHQTPFRQNQQQQLESSPINRSLTVTGQELRRRTPFPIVDIGNRGPVDRIIDAILGDNPHDRFALICRSCLRHNGMVHVDDFDYTAYHCAYCNTLNPARKTRPIAPRLSLEQRQHDPATPLRNVLNNSSGESSSSEDDDSENEEFLPSAPTEQVTLSTSEIVDIIDNEAAAEIDDAEIQIATAVESKQATLHTTEIFETKDDAETKLAAAVEPETGTVAEDAVTVADTAASSD